MIDFLLGHQERVKVYTGFKYPRHSQISLAMPGLSVRWHPKWVQKPALYIRELPNTWNAYGFNVNRGFSLF